jgi:hypothetical protein
MAFTLSVISRCSRVTFNSRAQTEKEDRKGNVWICDDSRYVPIR